MSEFDAAAYTITIKRVCVDDEICFSGRVAELPDVNSYADTHSEAYEEIIEALQMLYENALESGKDFPLPFAISEATAYNGRVTLRMGKTLHASIARHAQNDGISLNQWLVEAASEKAGRSTTSLKNLIKVFLVATTNTFSTVSARALPESLWASNIVGYTCLPSSQNMVIEAIS